MDKIPPKIIYIYNIAIYIYIERERESVVYYIGILNIGNRAWMYKLAYLGLMITPARNYE